MRTTPLTLALVAALPLSAQRIPDPVDNRREIQLHDVRAVLEAIGLTHSVTAPALGDEPDGALELHRRDRVRDLVELARVFVRPPLHDPTAVQPLGSDLLVLRGEPEQQACLEGILRALSRWEHLGIVLESQLVEVPQAAFAADIAPLLELGQDLDAGGGAVARLELDAARATRLEGVLKGIEGCQFLDSPRLFLLPAQHASMSIQNTIRYRQDYDVEAKGKDVTVWPITGELKDGLAVEFRAAPIADRTLGVEVRGTLSELQRPIPTFETALGVDGKRVTVDLPQVTVRRLDASLRLGQGDLGVIVGGTAEDAERLLFLVRASIE